MYRDFRARVVYQAGFATIPSDLCMVLANLASIAYNGGREVSSEQLGDWQYQYLTPEKCTMNDRRVLDFYKSRSRVGTT
jgi:hypothetical protein